MKVFVYVKLLLLADAGLEGFNEKEEYKYELKLDKNGKEYYKIYHDDNYSETCGS
jgi:hypothetical protein